MGRNLRSAVMMMALLTFYIIRTLAQVNMCMHDRTLNMKRSSFGELMCFFESSRALNTVNK